MKPEDSMTHHEELDAAIQEVLRNAALLKKPITTPEQAAAHLRSHGWKSKTEQATPDET